MEEDLPSVTWGCRSLVSFCPSVVPTPKERRKTKRPTDSQEVVVGGKERTEELRLTQDGTVQPLRHLDPLPALQEPRGGALARVLVGQHAEQFVHGLVAVFPEGRVGFVGERLEEFLPVGDRAADHVVVHRIREIGGGGGVGGVHLVVVVVVAVPIVAVVGFPRGGGGGAVVCSGGIVVVVVVDVH